MDHPLLQHYAPQVIVERLKNFLTKERRLVIETRLSQRLFSVQLAVERPTDMHNGLALVRTAEALGLTHLHFIDAHFVKGQGKNTTKGTLKWVHLRRHATLSSFLEEQKGFLIACASLDGERRLEELPLDRPLCFLFGNEKAGLSKEAAARGDLHFRIPMYGMVQSLNLSVAAGIVLYDYLKRKREALGKLGDLTEEQLTIERANYYIRTLGNRQAAALLQGRSAGSS